MIKKNRTKVIISSIVLLLPILFGLIVWNKLPEQIPTHWNAEGVVDGCSSKAFAVIGLPLIMFGLHWVCLIATSADPKNKEQTGKVFGLIFWICPILSILVGILTYGTVFGLDLSVEVIMPIVMGIVFVVIGNYLPKCKQNYTIGIKIPWTLNDEENWHKTHRFAGRAWVAGGLLILLTAFLPAKWIFLAFMIVVSIMVILPTVYSYKIYRRKNAKKDIE